MFLRAAIVAVSIFTFPLLASETATKISKVELKERSHSDFFKPVYLSISTHEYSIANQQLSRLPSTILKTAEAEYIKGLIALKLGNSLSALKHIDSAFKLAKKSNFSLQIEVARIYIELGHTDKARTILFNVINDSTNTGLLAIASKEIQYLEGIVLSKTNLDEAIEYFLDIENRYKSDYRIPLKLSNLYLKTFKLADAEKKLFLSLKLSKQYRSEILYQFVNLYINQDNIDLALSFFKRFKQTSINDHYRLKAANELIQFSDKLIKHDNLSLAERIMVVVLDENVNIGNAVRAIVFLYLQNNDFEKAERVLDKYKKENVDKEIILSLFYQLYATTNKIDEAIDLFESQARNNSTFLQGSVHQELIQLYRKKYKQHINRLPNGKMAALNYARFLLNNSLVDTSTIALEYSRELIKILPAGPNIYHLHSQILTSNNFIGDAISFLSNAIRLNPSNITWLFEYADLLDTSENYGAAINLLATLANHDNKEIRTRADNRLEFVRGKVFIRQKQYDQALSVYVNLLKKQPGKKSIIKQLATIYLAVGNIPLANQLTKQIEIIDSSFLNKEKTIRLSSSLIRNGQISRAATLLTRSARQLGNDSEILYWLGYALAQGKDYENALIYILRSYQLDPTNTKTANYAANLMIKAEKFEEAKQHYLRLIDASDSNNEKREYMRLYNLIEGRILVQEGETQLALEHYISILSEYPNDIDTQNAILDIHKTTRNWLSAIAVYKNLIKHDPMNTGYLFNLAVQYEYLGDEPQKEELLLQILKDNPNSKQAKLARAHFLKKGNQLIAKKRYDEAEKLFSRVLMILPGDTEFSSQISFTYAEQGKTEEAEKIYLTSLAKEPFNSALRSNLAKLYTKLDRTEDAASQYRSIIYYEQGKSLGRRAKANLTFLYGDKSNKMRDRLKTHDDIPEAISFSRMLIKDSYYDQAFQVLIKAMDIAPDDPQVNYWLGTIYSAKQKYKLALKHIGKSIKENPYNMLLVSALARVQTQSGDLDGALNNYKRILKSEIPDQMRSDTKKLLGFAVGQKLMLQNRYEDALKHYQDMAREFKQDSAVDARIATVHIRLQNYNTAEELMKEVIVKVPGSAASHMQLAEIYRLKGKQTEYKNELKQVLLLDPSGLGLRILDRLGVADGDKYLKEKNWTKANEAFDQILQFSPNNHVALIGKAKALSEQRLVKEARELLFIVVDEDPANYKARLELAKLYVLQGDINNATIELERILYTAKYSKEGQEALINLKKIYRKYGADMEKAGKFGSAVNFFKRIVDQDPTDIQAHLSLGSIYSRTSDKKELAIEHYLKVIKLDQFNSRAHTNLGSVYEVLARNEDARNSFANAVAFTITEDKRLITNLVNGIRIQSVRIEFAKKNNEWAVAEMIEISKADPTNVQYHLFLAIIYTSMEELEKAIAALNEGVVNDPKNNVVRFRLANLYERTSEFELALAHYRAILRSKEDGPIFETALDRVPILDQLVRTFNFNMQYLLTKGTAYYRESGQSVENFSSTMMFNMSARIRPTKALNMSLTASPTYTTLHSNNFDSLALRNFSFNGGYNSKNGYLNTAASYRRSEGLLTEQVLGHTYTANGALGYRLKLPRFLDANDRRLPKTFELSGAALILENNRKIDATFTDAYNVSGKFTLINPLTSGGSWIASYGYALNLPTISKANDYAYGAHQVSLTLSRVLARRITGTLSFSGEYRNYLNIDQYHAFTTGAQVRRRYAHASANARVEFRAHTKLNVFANISAFEARSTLGIGNMYREGIPFIQSGGITDNRNISSTLGMRFIF